MLALAALPPPDLSRSIGTDASFACVVAARCLCFGSVDAYEARDGAMADEIAAATHAVEAPSAAGPGIELGRAARSRPISSEPGVDLVRELLHSRYHHLPQDVTVATGVDLMFERARRHLCEQLASITSSALPASTFAFLRAHAWALRTSVASLARGNDRPLSPAIWRIEVGSLLEDTVALVLGAREAEAVLRWSAGLQLQSHPCQG